MLKATKKNAEDKREKKICSVHVLLLLPAIIATTATTVIYKLSNSEIQIVLLQTMHEKKKNNGVCEREKSWRMQFNTRKGNNNCSPKYVVVSLNLIFSFANCVHPVLFFSLFFSFGKVKKIHNHLLWSNNCFIRMQWMKFHISWWHWFECMTASWPF